MKNKPVRYVLFAILCCIQLYIPVSMVLQQNDTLNNGVPYKFLTAPVDPNDIFRGKYIYLQFSGNEVVVDSTKVWNYDQEVFVSLEKDDKGFAKIKTVSSDQPDVREDFMQAKILSIYPDQHKITLQFPFERYYMEEFDAPVAESVYAEAAVDTSSVTYALVMVKNGKTTLKDVFIDNIPVKTIVSQKSKEK